MPRVRKPTALKLLDGNPGKRAINRNEPSFSAVSLDPPSDLSGESLEMWHEFAAEMDRLGMLDICNRRALRLACLCYETAITAFAEGSISKAERMNTAYRQWCAKFGWTPADKSGISVPGKPDENPFDEF